MKKSSNITHQDQCVIQWNYTSVSGNRSRRSSNQVHKKPVYLHIVFSHHSYVLYAILEAFSHQTKASVGVENADEITKHSAIEDSTSDSYRFALCYYTKFDDVIHEPVISVLLAKMLGRSLDSLVSTSICCCII
jgi:hypothetical protein